MAERTYLINPREEARDGLAARYDKRQEIAARDPIRDAVSGKISDLYKKCALDWSNWQNLSRCQET